LYDPILHIMTPQDFSWITFTLIYISLLLGLIDLFQKPEQLILALQAYCIMNFFRIISLLFVPLDEPIGIIVMRDPFVAIVGYGGNVITKDLFFSGHVATMTLLVLVVTNSRLKSVLFGTTILIASLLLVQRVHYTIDVLVAPIISYISFRLSKLFSDKFAWA
jgi:PAP2 superfamily C-terminal